METTLDHLDIPSTATLLHSSKLQPAPKITTNLPNPSPPISPPTSPTSDNIPQFILSATLPAGLFPSSSSSSVPSSPSVASPVSSPSTPTLPPPPPPPAPPVPPLVRNASKSTRLTLSKDPLSLPLTSANFRRFVACVGPAFWLIDRTEEIVLWKKGYTWTILWITLFGGLCRFPQLILCIPHIALIAIILATYPYSQETQPTRTRAASTSIQTPPLQTQEPSSLLTSIPYQSNLQAIQNLMGTFSDTIDLVKPHIRHLILTPDSISIQHSQSPLSSSPSSSSSAPTNTSQQTQFSPWTVHILTFLILTLPPLVFLVSLPLFPLRLAIFIAGAGPIVALHPWVRNELFPTLVVVALWAWNRPVPPNVLYWYTRIMRVVRAISELNLSKIIARQESGGDVEKVNNNDDNNNQQQHHHHHHHHTTTALKSIFERIIDNDRLSDECWISQMRDVELWENERYLGPISAVVIKPSLSSIGSTSSIGQSSSSSFGSFGSLRSLGSTASKKATWSKANLRSTDRMGWTRRRDGWNGRDDGSRDVIDEEYDAAVDSRLTFPLAPGWSFVESEDWRKDVTAKWATSEQEQPIVVVLDDDGWVYTNDVWMEGAPYVTRRRRWVRRVWFDPSKEREYRIALEA